MKLATFLAVVLNCLFCSYTNASDFEEQPIVTAPILPQGPDPYAHVLKLKYCYTQSKEQTNINVSQILDTAEFYKLSPTFWLNGGHRLFAEVCEKYENGPRAFPFKKLPAMVGTLVFDKIIMIPFAALSLWASYQAALANARQDFGVNFADPWFVDHAASGCQVCDEEWMDLRYNESDPRNIKIDNITLYYIPFSNVPFCSGVLETAKYYVAQAVENAQWNTSLEDQGYLAIKLTQDTFYTVYQVSGRWGYPNSIETFNCSLMSALNAATAFSNHAFGAIMGAGAAGLGYAASWWVGNTCLK